MSTRVVPVVAWVAFVGALAVYVAMSGPADNDIVYRYETEVEVSVDVVDPGVEMTVAGVGSRPLSQIDLWTSGNAAVVVTVNPLADVAVPSVTIGTDAATLTGHDDYEVIPTTVLGDERLEIGVPTVVMLDVRQPVEVIEGESIFVDVRPTVPVEVTVPIQGMDAPIATVTATLTPVGITGDDLGIAGVVDIPDQHLPRPLVGEALPVQLDDGRPAWVIGLDDTVVVLDARSPHAFSGLVGWCGSMPGFIDSIGASRFTPTGEYRFGPAPHGLVPYAVEVADDHVIITHRLPPSPQPHTSRYVDHFPRIEGSPVAQGPYCDIDSVLAQQAHEDGYFLEDYRHDPTYVQHDLADWPPLAGAVGDGWFRTGEHHLDGGPHLVGDLLVHRERGVIVDAASPPGTARYVYSGEPADPITVTGRYAQTGPPVDGRRPIVIEPVMWVTATGISPADAPPEDPGRHLTSTRPLTGYSLAEGVEIDVRLGDVVTLTVVDQQVTDISKVG